jgi:hypothetical protein
VLHSSPTVHGAGVVVFGDEADFASLLCTIRRLYDGPPFEGNLEEFLYDFAYDVDSARSGSRTPLPAGHGRPPDERYNWVLRLWPRFLMNVGMLRVAAGFHPTSKGDQSNLYALEQCAEDALLSCGTVAGREALDWLDRFMDPPPSYLAEFVSEIEARYVGVSGKTRFARLPEFLRMLSPFSKEYEDFEQRVRAKAINGQSERSHPAWKGFPEFEW